MRIKFKHDIDRKLFCSLHPALLLVFIDLWNYAYDKYGYEITVTDTVSTLQEDINLGRKSSSHRKCLALDWRTRDIDAFHLQDIIEYIESKPEYDKYKYMSKSGKRRLIYVHNHNKNGEHAHMAIHQKYAIQ